MPTLPWRRGLHDRYLGTQVHLGSLKLGRLPAERLDFDTLSRNNLACSSGYIYPSKLDSRVLIGIGNCAIPNRTTAYLWMFQTGWLPGFLPPNFYLHTYVMGQPASLSINHRPPFPLTHLRRIPLTNVLLALSLWGYGSIVGVLSTSSNHHRYHLSSRRH